MTRSVLAEPLEQDRRQIEGANLLALLDTITLDDLERAPLSPTPAVAAPRQHDPLTAPDGPALSYETYEALGLAKTAKEKSSALFPNPNQPFDTRVGEMTAARTAVHEAHNVQSGGVEPYEIGSDSLPKAGVPSGRIIRHAAWTAGPDSVYPAVSR